jgi:galactose mutarotase-like enzyme
MRRKVYVMRYVLENDVLRVEIDSFGSELKSVQSKETGLEYMWQGDPKFWARTSPVLFPFVGSLKNKEYIHEGKHYPMGQHGFARDMEHTLVSKSDSEIWFELLSNEDTLEKFPFEFKLSIGYKLEANKVKVLWKVENPAENTLYFSIGAHPAFNCPIHGEEKKAGYSMYFGGVDEIHHHGNSDTTGLALKEDIVLSLKDHKAVITEEFFDRCTYMIEDRQCGSVGIVDPSGRRFVTVEFDMPLFAVWSPEKKQAPFICIEPWCGRCDADDFSGELKDREFTNVLEANEQFATEYTMIFE